MPCRSCHTLTTARSSCKSALLSTIALFCDGAYQSTRRHNDQVVVYDPHSKQLVLRNASSQGNLDFAECPYCHRPLREEDRPRSREHGGPGPGVSPGFVSPEYFRMLHQSLLSDAAGPPSPRRRLVQPVRSRDVSSSSTAPNVGFEDVPETPPTSPGISSSAFSPGYFERFFVQERELGRGGKGVVLLVKHMLDGVLLGHFACKRVPVGDDHEWLKKVLVEVQLLQYLSHQHLVSYRHVWLEDVKLSNFGPSVPCAFILQQYCNAGDLQKYISKGAGLEIPPQSLKERMRRRSKAQIERPQELRGRKLNFDEIYSFFKDITSGLNHLHVNGYIHRDLKPNNCLLHDSGHGLRALVSDFGEVQIGNMVRKSTGATGTISYCAPEVLQREPSGRYGNFTPKSDIFSLGMILYFLCFARLPYSNANALDEDGDEDLDLLRDEITSWAGLHEERKLRPDLPEKLYTFLRRLLSLDPADRPSAEDILLGIKTGSGLDEISDSRPSSSGHMFDDLRNSSRISPVDSPASRVSRSPMPQTPPRKMSTGFTRPAGGLAKLRMASFVKDYLGSPSTPAVEESPPPASPGGSLVLREKYPSPSRVDPLPSLPAPPPYATLAQVNRLGRFSTARTIKGAVFLLKVLSITTLCGPVASNGNVAYPMLAVAVVDLCLDNPHVLVSIALSLLHVVALLLVWRMEMLCQSRAKIWGVT
jgi:serine/threonine protein kinase